MLVFNLQKLYYSVLIIPSFNIIVVCKATIKIIRPGDSTSIFFTQAKICYYHVYGS